MPDRISCCVPGCRRTRKPDGYTEWICEKHWRHVHRSVKAAYNLAKKRARKIYKHKPEYRSYWLFPKGSPGRLSGHSVRARLDQAWETCKISAIETAMGI